MKQIEERLRPPEQRGAARSCERSNVGIREELFEGCSWKEHDDGASFNALRRSPRRDQNRYDNRDHDERAKPRSDHEKLTDSSRSRRTAAPSCDSFASKS